MLILDQDSLAQTEGGEVPGMFAPALQTSGESCFHGQLPLLPAVDPDLGRREVAWFNGKKVLDWTAEDELGWGELVLRVWSVSVLHDGSHQLVLVRGTVGSRVLHEDSLG